MNILTLEIKGAPVACICAANRAKAARVLQQSWFHRDLLATRSGGAPLWDGSVRLSLRDPTTAEAEAVEKHFEAHNFNDPHIADDGAVVYLIPIDAKDQSIHDDPKGDFPV